MGALPLDEFSVQGVDTLLLILTIGIGLSPLANALGLVAG